MTQCITVQNLKMFSLVFNTKKFLSYHVNNDKMPTVSVRCEGQEIERHSNNTCSDTCLFSSLGCYHSIRLTI